MKYFCSECELSVIVIDGVVYKPCECDAPIIADMESNLEGRGGVK